MNPSITIARFTLLEAVRNRLFALMLVGMICILGLIEFAGDLAITESREIQAALLGSASRLFLVFVVSLFVATSLVRELNDKGLELILSQPIRRSSYLLGKFCGFYFLAAIVSLIAGVLLLIYSEPADVLRWMLSLNCELALVVALSLLCLVTFSNVTIAFTVVIATYLLSRTIVGIQLIGNSPILEGGSFAQDFMRGLLDIIAHVLPRLDLFTQTDWLVYGSRWEQLLPVLSQTGIYLLLLLAAALFDLYRKNI